MDINALLKGVDCSCGKRHECPIDYVFVERGATRRLGEICKGFSAILLVADENTYSAAGAGVELALGERIRERVIFSGSSILIPDEAAIGAVSEVLDGVDHIIGIGSGVIQDLCKYVSHVSGISYSVVATAPSMDGYASTGAAMILKGMKETVKAGLPLAIVADTEVLKNAPMEMIKAGYGDIIGKYSALCDWRLSAEVNGEYFCSYIHDVTFSMIERTLDCADGLLKRDEDSIATVMEALITVGIMMSFAGSSRPASGSEHHLSHFFEIVGIVKGEPYFPHGIDVAYSTVITAALREGLVRSSLPEQIYRKKRSDYEEKIRELYGASVGDGCIALQDRIGAYGLERLPVYREKWETVRHILSDMPSAEEIRGMLARVGLDMADFYRLYGREKIENAVLYSKDLKDRYTVLMLNWEIRGERGFDPKAIKLIAMDLDGTLTQHKEPLTESNRRALDALSKRYKLLMVGAGQVGRIFAQLGEYPIDIIGNYGLQYGEYDKQSGSIVTKRDETFPVERESVDKRISTLREKHGFTEFAGDNTEFHPSGCVTFPVLGTKARQADKLAFDPDRKKRRAIYGEVIETFPEYRVFVGGSSSFDMSPYPYDKYYALDLYCREHGIEHCETVYVGDDYGEGGNDESVYLSDFNYLKIDDYREYPSVVESLLRECENWATCGKAGAPTKFALSGK